MIYRLKGTGILMTFFRISNMQNSEGNTIYIPDEYVDYVCRAAVTQWEILE